MKNLKLYKALIIMVMVFCTSNIFAQTNNIPAPVVAAFTAKYPKAELKKWEITNDQYTAKAAEDHQKFEAAFDGNGQWLKTTTRISWSRNLPAEIRASLKSSKYADWRVDNLRKVDSPEGTVYQVLVDNLYLQIDGTHSQFEQNRVLNFKPEGTLIAEQSIKSPLLF